VLEVMGEIEKMMSDLHSCNYCLLACPNVCQPIACWPAVSDLWHRSVLIGVGVTPRET